MGLSLGRKSVSTGPLDSLGRFGGPARQGSSAAVAAAAVAMAGTDKCLPADGWDVGCKPLLVLCSRPSCTKHLAASTVPGDRARSREGGQPKHCKCTKHAIPLLWREVI
jgi:hypothetical protein